MTSYLIPSTVSEALEILAENKGEAVILAGGTDLLPDIRKGKQRPRPLVDITRIPGMTDIHIDKTFVEVGAAVTFSALRAHPFLRSHVHALTEAAASVGALGIQNAATWAGNIVQAMPAADGAVVAVALAAEALVNDSSGQSWQPVADLFKGPGQSSIDPTRQLITRLRFPLPAGSWGSAWSRIGRRPSLVLPILNCAVTLSLSDDRVTKATIALGPVAPTPFRARQAEAFLEGRIVSRDNLEAAAELAQQAATPRDSIMRASRAYRHTVLPIMVTDALTQAAQRAFERP